jgi:NADH-quinone oxidoreductase subunit G
MAEQGAGGVSIVVDGRPVEARAGELVIAAAERAGVFIPRFCYHPRMKPVGMCRMCLVEVKGPRGFSLQPACFIQVAEGQEVVTASPKVKKAQDGVLEFLLINHPLDCPVCDKGGECPLQDQTLAYGPGESRFIEEKRHFEKPIAISPLVYLDRERCIQCGRCTRFAAEVAGDPLIEFFSRGDHLEVNTFPGQPFSSYFSGNTVQICPVGALTATPYRFRARPWDLDQVESTCTTCALGCRVVVQSSSNRLTRYLGVDCDPVNQGWLCDKGRFDFEAVNSDQRLAEPLVRRGQSLVPASWGEALEEAASAIERVRREHGPSAVGVLGGARLGNEDAYAWVKLAKSAIGTDSVDAQMGDGLAAELVVGLPRATLAEACQAGLVVLVAPDLREALPVLYLRLRQAVLDRGLRVLELSPVPTSMTPHAQVSLRHRPGELDRAVRALVSGAGPGGDLAGCHPAELEAARQLLSEPAGQTVVVLGRPSLAESPAPTEEAARQLFAALPGARFLPALPRANVHGALDLGWAPGLLPGRVALEQGRTWFNRAWGPGSVPTAPGLDAQGMLRAAAEGRLHLLVLVGADPLADFPDRRLATEALERVESVIVVDGLLNESAQRADVVLPVALYAERPGTTTNVEGRVSRLGQKVVAPGLAWPDWMVASELAARLGGELDLASYEGIWDEIEKLSPVHAGLTLELLGSEPGHDGVVVPLPATRVSLAPPAPIDPIATPGIDSVERQGAASLAGAARPPGASLVEPAPGTSAARPQMLRLEPQSAPQAGADRPAGGGDGPERPGELRLVSQRRLYDRGTLVSACPSLAPLAGETVVRAHPEELARAGVAPGARTRVSSPRGEVVVRAVADGSMPPGVAEVPFNLAGPRASELIDSSRTYVTVRLEPAGG